MARILILGVLAVVLLGGVLAADQALSNPDTAVDTGNTTQLSVSNGTEITHSYPGLAVLGIVGVGVSMLVLAKGSLELLRTQ